jgi:hypothetical protein
MTIDPPPELLLEPDWLPLLFPPLLLPPLELVAVLPSGDSAGSNPERWAVAQFAVTTDTKAQRALDVMSRTTKL